MSKRKIVVTGAAGYVAGRMLPALQERYETVTLLDVKTRPIAKAKKSQESTSPI